MKPFEKICWQHASEHSKQQSRTNVHYQTKSGVTKLVKYKAYVYLLKPLTMPVLVLWDLRIHEKIKLLTTKIQLVPLIAHFSW